MIKGIAIADLLVTHYIITTVDYVAIDNQC